MSFITMETANLIQTAAEFFYNTKPNNTEVHKNTYSSSRLKTISPWWLVRCSENPLWIPVCTWWTQQNFPPAAEKGKQTAEMRFHQATDDYCPYSVFISNPTSVFTLDCKPVLMLTMILNDSCMAACLSLFVLTHRAHLCNVELSCGQFHKLLSLIRITCETV